MSNVRIILLRPIIPINQKKKSFQHAFFYKPQWLDLSIMTSQNQTSQLWNATQCPSLVTS